MHQINAGLIEEQEKKISENDNTILELKQSIEELRKQLASTNADIKEKKKKLDEIQASSNKSKENLAIVSDELSMKLIEMEQLTLNLEATEFSEKEIEETQAQSIEYQNVIQDQKVMIERLESELSGKKMEISELGKTIGLSKQNVSQLEIKLEKLTSQLKDANNRGESLEMKLDTTAEKLKQVQESMLAAKNNNFCPRIL